MDDNEPLPINRDPLNQLAKKFLHLEKQDPQPDSLYLLQLAQWGIDSGKVGANANPQLRSDLRESLDNLLTWEPAEAHRYLVNNPDDSHSPLLSPKLMRRALSAKRAARVVLNALDLRLTADQALNYPPTRYQAR